MRDFEMAKLLISYLDLTSLNKNDTGETIQKLCKKALGKYGHTAAVCVYPRFVKAAHEMLKESDVKIATVVNFPKGEGDFEQMREEILTAVNDGADEIDAVFPYNDFLSGNLDNCRRFLDVVTQATVAKKNKIILESGAFPYITELQAACRLCLEYNINFLKTSTGKSEISATPEAANAILEVIRDTPRNVGFKASGGIKTFEDARKYFILAQSIMGDEWMGKEKFRIGASSLLDDLIKVIQQGY
ncbi:MAG: deoxyribose-phosphate aldolase [Alphaproteobacteria bacterium]|nr:deoxyribose-phosphate aldolase [Alphaproteobacteria bacterium]